MRFGARFARQVALTGSAGGYPSGVDVAGESVCVLGEEPSEVGVVAERPIGVELVPDRVAAGLPGALDVRGLGRLDGSGCEEVLALGRVAPDDLGCALAFEVAECGLVRAWNRR